MKSIAAEINSATYCIDTIFAEACLLRRCLMGNFISWTEEEEGRVLFFLSLSGGGRRAEGSVCFFTSIIPTYVGDKR